jgi:hypothetical protein
MDGTFFGMACLAVGLVYVALRLRRVEKMMEKRR